MRQEEPEDAHGSAGPQLTTLDAPGTSTSTHTVIDLDRSSQVVIGNNNKLVVNELYPRLPRSAYLAQVRDIAPERLLDRRGELAALADSCLGTAPYVWWQAGPWAGKSALMSWFVLHPPPHTDIISFFVTGRWQEQADSSAFSDAILQQLCSLLDEEMPSSSMPGPSKNAYRLTLLEKAADRAHANHRRLVLVIDGLDEDRGHSFGGGIPSIATMLPRKPHPGLRVIVAGRPNPPIPDDVDSDHPLRNCRVITLEPSAHARRIKALAQAELSQILERDSPDEKDVIGILTAALGGLTTHDLERLTGLPPYRLSRILRGVTGRTFTNRAVSEASTGPKSGVERIYLFAHETLQVAAEESLGQELILHYRDKIHRWADSYKLLGWPKETPRYLMYSYAKMVRLSQDTDRLLALASDAVRHDRMLDHMGGDAVSMEEIAAAQRASLAEHRPDLLAACRLAAHRQELFQRSAHLPQELPAVWASVGNYARAECLAYSITDAATRARALMSVACQMRSNRGRNSAETAIRSVELCAALQDPGQRARLYVDLAAGWLDLGNSRMAADCAQRALQDALASPFKERMPLLTELPESFVRIGYGRAALKCADAALDLVARHGDPHGRVDACTSIKTLCLALTEQLTASGRYKEALDFGGLAVKACVMLGFRDLCAAAMGEVSERMGKLTQQLIAAGKIPVARIYGRNAAFAAANANRMALHDSATAIHTMGSPETMITLLVGKDSSTGSRPQREWEVRVLLTSAHALAMTGNLEEALATAHTVADPELRAHGLLRMCMSIQEDGRADDSLRILEQVDGLLEQSTPSSTTTGLTVQVADGYARLGRQEDFRLAAAMARTALADDRVSAPTLRALISLARIYGENGEVGEVVELGSAIRDRLESRQTREAAGLLGDLAVVHRDFGLREQAASIVQAARGVLEGIGDPSQRLLALLKLRQQALDVVDPMALDDTDVSEIIRLEASGNERTRGEHAATLTRALISAGDRSNARRFAVFAYDIAMRVARATPSHIPSSHLGMWMTDLGRSLAELGCPREAAHVASAVPQLDQRVDAETDIGLMFLNLDLEADALRLRESAVRHSQSTPRHLLRDEVLTNLAVLCAKTRDVEQSLVLLSKLGNREGKFNAAVDLVAQAKSVIDEPTSAGMIIRFAVQLLDEVTGHIDAGIRIRSLVDELVAAERHDLAVAVVRELSEGETQATTALYLMQALMQNRYLPEAKAVPDTVRGDLARARLTARLAQLLADSDRQEEARELATRSERIAREAMRPHFEQESLVSVVRASILLGEFERAASVVREIRNETLALDLSTEIAHARLWKQRAENPGMEVHENSEWRAKSSTLALLQSLRLIELAVSLDASGDKGRVKRIIKDAEDRARYAPNPYQRTFGLVEVSIGVSVISNMKEAVRIARAAEAEASRIESDYLRAVALGKLTIAYGTAGQVSDVERIAQSTLTLTEGLSSPKRAAVFTLAALGLSLAGKNNEARQLLARCLVLAPWPVSMPSMAKVDSESLNRFLEERVSAFMTTKHDRDRRS